MTNPDLIPDTGRIPMFEPPPTPLPNHGIGMMKDSMHHMGPPGQAPRWRFPDTGAPCANCGHGSHPRAYVPDPPHGVTQSGGWACNRLCDHGWELAYPCSFPGCDCRDFEEAT